ncbi:MAG: hypothetical protein Q8P20_01770 [bacterium]|nr:hypothetical protein [bacterium]
MEKISKIQYWLFTTFFLVISYFLIIFNTQLVNGWSNLQTVTTFDWIKSRLGEVIGFGISVVILIYFVSSIVILIVNVNKFGFKNINYKALARLHSVVFTALIIYAVLYSIFFIKF